MHLKMTQLSIIFVFFVLLFVLRVESTWLGYSYWTQRYSSDGISYSDDIDSGIWWNDHTNGRRFYEPSNQWGTSCGGCKCTSSVIDCSSASATV